MRSLPPIVEIQPPTGDGDYAIFPLPRGSRGHFFLITLQILLEPENCGHTVFCLFLSLYYFFLPQVAGLGIPPMYLLAVVSQWHDSLVVRCYDFLSGETRQAERTDPDRDAALILEFQVRIYIQHCIKLPANVLCTFPAHSR